MGEMLDDGHTLPPSVEIQQVYGASSKSIKVSWRLTTSEVVSIVDGKLIPFSIIEIMHLWNYIKLNIISGFYILYRSCIGEPPGFTSITVLHAAATSYVVNR